MSEMTYEQLVWNAHDLHQRYEAAKAAADALLEGRRLAFHAVVEGRGARTMAQVAADIGASATAIGTAHRLVSSLEAARTRREGERRRAAAAMAAAVESGGGAGLLVAEVGLSPRVVSALGREGVRTLAGVAWHCAEELLEVRGLGPGGLEELVGVLSRLGLELTADAARVERGNFPDA